MIKVTYPDRYHYTVRGLTSDQMGMLLNFLETARVANQPGLTGDARELHGELLAAVDRARPERDCGRRRVGPEGSKGR